MDRLESGIKDLKSRSPDSSECRHIDLLIHTYEWALAEFEGIMEGRPLGNRDRLVALSKLLDMPALEFDAR